jgi:hypothetical protein
MRRLLGADSLRSNNRFFRGPSPRCGDIAMRRLLGADSLRSNNRFFRGPSPRCGDELSAGRPPST